MATLRVTFAYRGTEVRLAGVDRVMMIAPPAAALPREKEHAGSWFEVRGGDNGLLFYRPLHNPIGADTEVFSAVDKQTITRIPIAEPSGEFEVLVPDDPAAAALSLWGPPPGAEMQSTPSRELLRVGFDELRRVATDSSKPGSGGGGRGDGAR